MTCGRVCISRPLPHAGEAQEVFLRRRAKRRQIASRDAFCSLFASGEIDAQPGLHRQQLGPAVNSGKSLFLYGAPGNGKTVVAQGIGKALGADMFIPHAIDVEAEARGLARQRNRPRRANSGASLLSNIGSIPS